MFCPRKIKNEGMQQQWRVAHLLTQNNRDEREKARKSPRLAPPPQPKLSAQDARQVAGTTKCLVLA
eukprot:4977012-Amphidinium_carterae.1